MSDGQPTPGIFDGMAAYPGPDGTILIRNHENREQSGEIKVVTPSALQYNLSARGGNTKLVVRRKKAGKDPVTGQQLYTYDVERDFAILGGTSTNCAGGIRSPHVWITCEEVVKRLNGIKHGYLFEIDARSDEAVPAIAVRQAGRRAHEAALERAGIIYMTEDRSITPDPVLGSIGSCFYRYIPRPRGGAPLAETTGPLQALKLRDEVHANMDVGRVIGTPYPVEWVRRAICDLLQSPQPSSGTESQNRTPDPRGISFLADSLIAAGSGVRFAICFGRLNTAVVQNRRIARLTPSSLPMRVIFRFNCILFSFYIESWHHAKAKTRN